MTTTNTSKKRRFRVALSFAGERRGHIKGVAQCLADKLGKELVLYDKYYEPEFSRPKLDEYLPRLYREESDLIVVFLCDDYDKKNWTGLEWNEVKKLIESGNEQQVMLHSFSDSQSIKVEFEKHGYTIINENRTEMETANGIIDRLNVNDQQENQLDIEASAENEHLSEPALPPTLKDGQFLKEIKNNIEVILSENDSLSEALRRRLSLDKEKPLWNIVDELCRERINNAIAITLCNAASACYRSFVKRSQLKFAQDIKTDVYSIAGWLALLALDEKDIAAITKNSSNSKRGLCFDFPAKDKFEAELLLASKFQRPASTVADDETKSRKNRYAIEQKLDRKWMGWESSYCAKKLVREVWNALFRDERKGEADVIDLVRLNDQIRYRREQEHKGEHHYVLETIVNEFREHSDDICVELLKQIPQLTVVRFGFSSEKNYFAIPSEDIAHAISFLQSMFEELEKPNE